MSKLKVIILIGSLKSGSKTTNTLILSQFLAKYLSDFDTEYKIIKLADHIIKSGTYTNEGTGDDWPSILEKILDSDIVIFATPIWWGIQSSLIQSN